MSLRLTDRVAIAPDAMVRRLGEETVILDLASGTYFGLDEMGTRIWELMSAGKTLAEIRDAILDGFDVAPDRAEGDLIAFAASLLERRLIAIA